jgi:excisionase family DNA binding protein
MTGRLLLRAEEVAEELGIGRSTVYRLLQTGQLRGVLIGKARRFSRAEVEAFVERLRESDDAS